jgi:hypothetical protein
MEQGLLQAVEGLLAEEVSWLHHNACDAAHNPYLSLVSGETHRRNSGGYGSAQRRTDEYDSASPTCVQVVVVSAWPSLHNIPARKRFKKYLATVAFGRFCTKMTSTIPCWSMARQV